MAFGKGVIFMVKPLYKNGNERAVTLSFDDGTVFDEKIIAIFNTYNLKATFNLNGGKARNPRFAVEKDGAKLWDGSEELRLLYRGHEIALHSYTHPKINELPDDECRFEIEADKAALEKAFDCKIRGYAAPYGRNDERITEILRENGICYNRLVVKNRSLEAPADFLHWEPCPHFAFFATEEGKQLINEFFATEKPLPLLDVWGHSYELDEEHFERDGRWDILDCPRFEWFENFCKTISNRKGVWYATNIEIYDYITAMRKAKFDDTYIDNPTDETLFFSVNGKTIAAPPHSRFSV